MKILKDILHKFEKLIYISPYTTLRHFGIFDLLEGVPLTELLDLVLLRLSSTNYPLFLFGLLVVLKISLDSLLKSAANALPLSIPIRVALDAFANALRNSNATFRYFVKFDFLESFAYLLNNTK